MRCDSSRSSSIGDRAGHALDAPSSADSGGDALEKYRSNMRSTGAARTWEAGQAGEARPGEPSKLLEAGRALGLLIAVYVRCVSNAASLVLRGVSRLWRRGVRLALPRRARRVPAGQAAYNIGEWRSGGAAGGLATCRGPAQLARTAGSAHLSCAWRPWMLWGYISCMISMSSGHGRVAAARPGRAGSTWPSTGAEAASTAVRSMGMLLSARDRARCSSTVRMARLRRRRGFPPYWDRNCAAAEAPES
jgi:hypothetical protein